MHWWERETHKFSWLGSNYHSIQTDYKIKRWPLKQFSPSLEVASSFALFIRAKPWNPFLYNLLTGVIWSWQYINHRLRVEIWYTEDLGYRMSALFLRGSTISNKLYAFLFNSSHYLSKNFFAKRLPLITQPYLATLGSSYTGPFQRRPACMRWKMKYLILEKSLNRVLIFLFALGKNLYERDDL